MTNGHYEEFKKSIKKRDEHKKIAEKKSAEMDDSLTAFLTEWAIKRHTKRAKQHNEKAIEHAVKHAEALKKKHKI
ncbi:MAG: hypothetical protein COV47_03430 [Candidatus Diapherotrites archaeon CG11_big_fil_rev_8_21_14_0_20_37_9]|nr:MAG: hypothetical protein COV47_03430 [Candidatus Diapherotrites archaeon CG11_big_fil_rev_8_21_14_0_20_37_9]